MWFVSFDLALFYVISLRDPFKGFHMECIIVHLWLVDLLMGFTRFMNNIALDNHNGA